MTCSSVPPPNGGDDSDPDYFRSHLGAPAFLRKKPVRNNQKLLRKALAIVEGRPEESSSDEESDEVNHNDNSGNSEGDPSDETNSEKEKQGE